MTRAHKTKTMIISQSRTKIALASLAAAVLTFGTTAFAAYDPATNTDTLTNRTISQTDHSVAGDLDSYNHPDRNLVINWTDDSRVDHAAICDGTATAKNITIDSNFPTKADFNWMDKGASSVSRMSAAI